MFGGSGEERRATRRPTRRPRRAAKAPAPPLTGAGQTEGEVEREPPTTTTATKQQQWLERRRESSGDDASGAIAPSPSVLLRPLLPASSLEPGRRCSGPCPCSTGRSASCTSWRRGEQRGWKICSLSKPSITESKESDARCSLSLAGVSLLAIEQASLGASRCGTEALSTALAGSTRTLSARDRRERERRRKCEKKRENEEKKTSSSNLTTPSLERIQKQNSLSFNQTPLNFSLRAHLLFLSARSRMRTSTSASMRTRCALRGGPERPLPAVRRR